MERKANAMEPPPNSSDELQKRAVIFVRDLLKRSNGKSSEDVAQSITNLALEEGNPVREFFLVAQARPAAIPSDRSVKSRSSSKILKLARREYSKISPSKTPTPNQPSDGKDTSMPDVKKSDEDQKPDKSNAKDEDTEKPNKGPSEMPYKCIVCNEDLSYKGVCKRHLDEQHVSPNVFQCERCSQCFNTKAEAKKHCNRCGMGNFHWNVVKPPAKTIYASEYTDEWFSSKSMYLEHLLKLSKKGSIRPLPSLHRKLRTLLGHPSLLEHVIDMSEVTCGLGDAWRRLRWSDTQLRLAIQQLEDAAVVHDNGIIAFEGHLAGTQQALNIRHFLHTLLSAGTLSDSEPHPGSPPPRQQESRLETRRSSVSTAFRRRSTPRLMSVSTITQLSANGYPPSTATVTPVLQDGNPNTRRPTPVTREIRAKRHRSDLSGSTEASRKPPAPPKTPTALHYPSASNAPFAQDARYIDMVSTSLPERSLEAQMTQHYHPVNGLAHAQGYGLMSPPSANMQQADLTSVSTMAPHQQESELQYAPPAYNLWPPQESLEFHFDYKTPHTDHNYGYPSDSSARASVATEHSYFDSSEDEQTMANYTPFMQYGATVGLGTFLLDEDEQQEMSALNQRFSGF